MEISLESLHETLPRTHQDNESSSRVSAIPTLGDVNTTIGRNPAYGSEDTAMGNYNHMDKPVHLTPAKGVSVSHFTTNDQITPATSVTGSSNTSTSSTTTTKTFTTTDGITTRSPEGGIEGAAIDNYTHMDNPTIRPIRRGPQLYLDTNDNTSQNSLPNDITSSCAPQGDNGVKDLHQTVIDANLGDKVAQVALGDMCKHGRGVNQNFETAMNWYMKAAEQGDPIGQCNVGVLYRDGLGVEQSDLVARHWFQESAKSQDPASQNNLGYMYQCGQGVDQNYIVAMNWYLESAKQGHAEALNNVGYMYQKGFGVVEDFSQAMEWYLKSVERGNPSAHLNVGWMYELGLGVPKKISKAIEWYKKAADLGKRSAKQCLDRLQQQGYDLETGKKRGLLAKWFK
ncbi:hypothetical protein BGX24_000207 [Mortierella sp. AD032]|nr:hypothetical protein BGX24_000207 [Mortierella sp. AD032]